MEKSNFLQHVHATTLVKKIGLSIDMIINIVVIMYII